MADRKSRSVVTDFGATPTPTTKATGKRASGKQASRERRADKPHEGAASSDASMRRTRPSTTETPFATAAPAAPNLPGAVAAGAHFAPGFDQSRLNSRTIERAEAPTAVQVADEILRTKDKRLHLINAPDSEAAAAMRVLRHQVEAAGNAQVIAVSSPSDGEGKTTTAANLALALAECGRASVLLVEANFRRPAIARMFNFSPQACFGEQIERYHSAPGTAWHVTSMAICNLQLVALARGRAPSPLLDGPAFRYAIDGLRGAGYDHIVIDCCSVLAGADVNLVQDAADGVVLVARARQTTSRKMRAAVERLTPSALLGTVLLG